MPLDIATLIDQHLATLDKIASKMERDLRNAPAVADESVSIEALLRRSFNMSFPNFGSDVATIRATLASAKKRQEALPKRNVIGRWLYSADIAKASKDVNDAQVALEVCEKKFITARDAYANDPNHLASARQELAKRSQQKDMRAKATAAAEQARAVETKLKNAVHLYGKNNVLAQVLTHEFDLDDDLHFSKYLVAVENGLASATPFLIARMEAMSAAHQVLHNLVCDDASPLAGAPQSMCARTLASLCALLDPNQALPTGTIDEALRAALDPCAFVRNEAWLVFWTSVMATADYAAKCGGSSITEDPKGMLWCGGWSAQFKQWGTETLSALGLDRDQLCSAQFLLQNGKGETLTGADTLFMLMVSHKGRTYCSAVNIQFKRPDDDGPTIDVENAGWRQYDTLGKLQHASNGRLSAMHAQLRMVAQGLATVPAVTLATSQTFFRRRPGTDLFHDTDVGPYRSNWKDDGESLCTSLTNGLCGSAAKTFDTIEDALTWVGSNAQVKLPQYMLIQGIGESSIGFDLAVKRGLLKINLDRDLKYVERVEPVIQQKPEPAPGMSL